MQHKLALVAAVQLDMPGGASPVQVSSYQPIDFNPRSTHTIITHPVSTWSIFSPRRFSTASHAGPKGSTSQGQALAGPEQWEPD